MKTMKKTLAIILTVIMTVISMPMASGLVSFAADCSADGHSYGEWFISLEPTCEKEGVESRVCSACNKNEKRYIDKLEHSYLSEVTVPTCIEEGYTTYTCSKCGDTYKDDIKVALGHKFGEWTTVTTPTCLTEGEESRTCSVCQRTETRETDTVDHDYKLETIAPTCQTEGYTSYKCSMCPDYYIVERTDALGHSYGEWEVTKEASCSEKGEKKRVCSTCGDTETEVVLKLSHTYTVSVVPSTCTGEGYTKYNCTVCGTEVINTIEALGHSFGDWQEIKAPSCTESGKQSRECSVCNTVETKATEKISHSYTTSETKPTCTDIGYITYTCTVCGYNYTDAVKAKGHKFSDWTEILVPTCTAKGKDTRICEGCGTVETRESAIAAHPYAAVYTPATCTTDGYTTYTCTACSDTVKINASKAKGHSDSNNDGACDDCGTDVPRKDQSEGCGCMCHKSGFMGLIYKIVSIFWKLFKTNPECECGAIHY